MPKSQVRKPSMQGKETAAMSAENTVLLNAIQQGVAYAVRMKEWVVVVTPNNKTTTEIKQFFAGIMPEGSSHTGRTTMFPEGGRFSIVTADSPMFVPDNQAVSAMFLGWETVDQSQYGLMDAWRARAQHVIDLLNSKDNVHR